MNELEFHRAVVADPDSDDLRLAYADWLDEHGDRNQRLRAEFVRGQIALANDTTDSAERRHRALRVRSLGQQFHDAWGGPLSPHCTYWQWVRGFPERVVIAGESLVRYSHAIFETTPVRRLFVTELKGQIAPLASIPEQNLLVGLELSRNALTSESFAQLGSLASLRHLRRLTLAFNRIDDAALSLAVPWLERLSHLCLAGNIISPDGREQLSRDFGERVSFEYARDPDHLYALPTGNVVTAGFGREATQLLFRLSDYGVRLAIFDHEGNLREVQDRLAVESHLERDGSRKAYDPRDAAKRDWMLEWEFEPRSILVKRFQFEDFEGIEDCGAMDYEGRFSSAWMTSTTALRRTNAAGIGEGDRWLGGGRFEPGM